MVCVEGVEGDFPVAILGLYTSTIDSVKDSEIATMFHSGLSGWDPPGSSYKPLG